MRHVVHAARALGMEQAVIEDVEPRILYSADATALAQDFGALAISESASVEIVVTDQATNRSVEPASHHPLETRELLVLGADIIDRDAILRDVQTRIDDGAALDIVQLTGEHDGVSVIADTLSQSHSEYRAVHVFTHGSAARFALGGDVVDQQNLLSQSSEFARWSLGLSTNADILLYGCDVASSLEGLALINDIGLLTGADVAASDDLTGHRQFDANWILERATGRIETDLLLSASLKSSWLGTLGLNNNGSEQRVNSSTSGSQSTSSEHEGRQIASNGSRVVAVWESSDQIHLRIYDTEGVALSSVISIPVDDSDFKRDNPSVAMAANGEFIVVYEGHNNDSGPHRDIFATRFNADGSIKARPAGAITTDIAHDAEFRLNTNSSNHQRYAAVAMRDNGSFVATWSSFNTSGSGPDHWDVRHREFDANGVGATGSDTLTFDDSSEITGSYAPDQRFSSIAVDQDGNQFVIAFERESSDNDFDIYAQRFDAALNPRGPAIAIAAMPGQYRNADVAMNRSGDFIVTFEKVSGSDANAMFQRVASDGNLLGAQTVAIGTDQDFVNASTAFDDAGNFVVIADFKGSSILNDWGVRMRLFSADGAANGSYVSVNSTVIGDQRRPSLVWHGDSVSALWSGVGSGDLNGVFMRQFTVAAAGLQVTPDVSVTSEGGDVVNLSMQLEQQPSNNVTVTVTSDDTSEGIADRSSVLFTPVNWNIAQFVRINGVDDPDTDGDIDYDISLDLSSSADSSYAALTTVLVNLTNSDDDGASTGGVGGITDIDANSNQIVENASNGSAVGIAVLAQDPDAGDSISYSLTNDAGGRFSISSLGIVSVASSAELDYEAQQSHLISVRATSSDSSFTDQNFTVQLLDENDEKPIITDAQSFSLLENSANSTVVGTVLATDVDNTGSLQNWAIIGGSGEDYFDIDASTGVLTVSDMAGLDYETITSLTLNLSVSDGVRVSDTVVVTVNLQDKNDVVPLVGSGQSFTIAEDVANGDVVGFASATDPDTVGNLQQWHLVGSGAFSIDANTGKISVSDRSLIDYEASTSMTVTVRVGDGVSTSVAQTLTIEVSDVDDVPPLVNAGQVFNVPQHSANGSSVATATASDVDSAQESLQDWQIVGGTGATAFSLDSATGELLVLDSAQLNLTVNASLTVVLTVSDGTNTSASQFVKIVIVQSNREPLGGQSVLTVSEDQLYSFTSSDFVFSDPDSGDFMSAIRIDSLPTQGSLLLDGSDILIGQSVSIEQINASRLQFIGAQDLHGEDIDSFLLTVFDSRQLAATNSQIQSISIVPVNDAPVVIGAQQAELFAGGALQITSGHISASDVESDADQIEFELSLAPSLGELTLDGSLLLLGDRFSQRDIDNGKLHFTSSGDEGQEALSFNVSDSDGEVVSNVIIEFRIDAAPVSAPLRSAFSSAAESRSVSSSSEALSLVDEVSEASEEGESSVDTKTSRQDSGEVGVIGAPIVAKSGSLSFASSGEQQVFVLPAVAERSKTVQDLSQSRQGEIFSSGSASDAYAGSRVSEILSRFEMASDSVIWKRINFGLVATDLAGDALNQALSQLRDDLRTSVRFDEQVVASSAALSSGISIGYVIWLLRSGALVSSVMASLPAWRSIDPFPVLASLSDRPADVDDESLEDMLVRAQSEGARVSVNQPTEPPS